MTKAQETWALRTVIGAALTGLLTWATWATVSAYSQETRITVTESKVQNIDKKLDKMDEKLDRLLSRRGRNQ